MVGCQVPERRFLHRSGNATIQMAQMYRSGRQTAQYITTGGEKVMSSLVAERYLVNPDPAFALEVESRADLHVQQCGLIISER